MRCRSLVLLSALLMLLTGCAQEAPAEPIFAIVEGVEIPVSRVDHTLALDEAAYEFSLRWIEDADFLTEEEKQEQIALMEPPTREAAEQELIRMEVLNARAREAGITVTREEARARLDETNAIAEELAAQGEKSAVWMAGLPHKVCRGTGPHLRGIRGAAGRARPGMCGWGGSPPPLPSRRPQRLLWPVRSILSSSFSAPFL